LYYRVIDELVEPPGKELDSRISAEKSARKVRAKQLYELFDCIGNFSSKEDVNLDAAANIATFPEIYIPFLKNALASGRQEVSFGDIGCFMIDREIKIKTLIDYMKTYQQLCEAAKTWITEKDADRECVWEYVWEKERRRLNADFPARGESVFLFDNEFDADQYREDYYGDYGTVMQVEIKEQRAFGRYDMSWFTGVPGTVPYNEAAMYARNYWHGKENDEPLWEYLLDGTYVLTPVEDDVPLLSDGDRRDGK
jgi:hypothetical protein